MGTRTAPAPTPPASRTLLPFVMVDVPNPPPFWEDSILAREWAAEEYAERFCEAHAARDARHGILPALTRAARPNVYATGIYVAHVAMNRAAGPAVDYFTDV